MKIDIATGRSINSLVWKNKKIKWEDLVDKLSKPVKTSETQKEYFASAKADKSKIKDVGGYVGGFLRGGRRGSKNIMHRQLLTLDIDFADENFWDDFTMIYSQAAVLHGTHSHSDKQPKYRLIMPMSREASPDEYVAIGRRIAGDVDIEQFDNTGFQPERLMFWHSTPSDVEPYFREQKGDWLDVDSILESYEDWRDTAEWSVSVRHSDRVRAFSDKQQDPELKKGIVGAFCRTYNVHEAIENFLADKYSEAGEDRYTYIDGSTYGGLLTYEDKFTFSHHGSDPTSGKLCNSFDLVRLHKYGHLDTGKQHNPVKQQSYIAMQDFARSLDEVKKVIGSERLEEAKYEFVDDFILDQVEEDDLEWVTKLEVDSKGNYLSSANNINVILQNDTRINNAFKENSFANLKYVCRSLPWRSIKEPDVIQNVDFAGLRNYLEAVYGITGTQKIDDALMLEFNRNKFNPVTEYLNSLTWDGEPRVDKLLIEYFGAIDNIYSREAIRKPLAAAVTRAFRAGTKFDLVLVLVGKEGTYKSTFFKNLGQTWFSDSFNTVVGKEAFEQLHGVWIMEMAELSGMRKAEVEAVKHYITKTEDRYRPAFGKVIECYKRQCVFFGTTNVQDFLRDPTGNRRFVPIDVTPHRITKHVPDMTQEEIDQIWAEAVTLYKNKERLYMSDEAEEIARSKQSQHTSVDERQGIIERFLDTKLPNDWDKTDLSLRRMFLDDVDAAGTVVRDYFCAAEVWCECLGKDKRDMDRYKTRDLNDTLKKLEGWEYVNSTKTFPIYGKQRYYRRSLI